MAKTSGARSVPQTLRGEPFAAWVVGLLLAVLVVVVFGQTLRNDFVNYDDDQYVYENPMVSNGLSFRAIDWAFTHPHAQNWHPLTTLSHMVDCQLYGLQPWGHHLTNVLLHGLAAILLFIALRRLTNAFWPSAMVAALFAVHPLHVGSVAWVAERKDVLSGVFFGLTLWAYARFVRSDRPSLARYAIALVFFALGLMSKPTLVTLPFVLLLLDYWPLRRFKSDPAGESINQTSQIQSRSVGYLVAEKIPFFMLAAASCVATVLAQGSAVIAIRQLTLGDRVANALVAYVAYLKQLIWPTNLAVVYPFPQGGWTMQQAGLALMALLIISVALFITRRRYPFLLVGWLWFLGMLVPMIGIVQVGLQARADRYTYLPHIGLYLLATWGAWELFKRWNYGRTAAIAFAILVVVACVADACFETAFWKNSETLWKRTLVCTSNNYIAENNLGDTLMRQEGRLDEAVGHLRRSLEISPEYPDANNNLGYALAGKGQWDEAVVLFQTAMRLRPNFPQAHSNLAVSLSRQGKTDEAIAELREALRLNENYRDAHSNLAILLLQRGERDEAIVHFHEALRLKPNDTAIREQLRQLGAEK